MDGLNQVHVSGDYNVVLQNIQAAGNINIVINQEPQDKLTIALNKRLLLSLLEQVKDFSPEAASELSILKSKGWRKELIASGKDVIKDLFGDIIGKRMDVLFKLRMNIGEKDLQFYRDYIENAYYIANFSMKLTIIMLVSNLWKSRYKLTSEQKQNIIQFLNISYQPDDEKLLEILQNLHDIYEQNKLNLPLIEEKLTNYNENFSFAYQELYRLFNKEDYVAKDVALAEVHLSEIMKYFAFWAKYKLISIKNTEYENFNEVETHFLVRHIEGNKNKYEVLNNMIYTPSVIILEKSEELKPSVNFVNLFPFVIDLNFFENGDTVIYCLYSHRKHNTLFYTDTQSLKLEKISQPEEEITIKDLKNAKRKDDTETIKEYRKQTVHKIFQTFLNFIE